MAKPVIATDTIVCRDIVNHRINGYLVEVRDSGDLAEKMELMIRLPREELVIAGLKGREKIVCFFDDKLLVARYFDTLKHLAR